MYLLYDLIWSHSLKICMPLANFYHPSWPLSWNQTLIFYCLPTISTWLSTVYLKPNMAQNKVLFSPAKALLQWIPHLRPNSAVTFGSSRFPPPTFPIQSSERLQPALFSNRTQNLANSDPLHSFQLAPGHRSFSPGLQDNCPWPASLLPGFSHFIFFSTHLQSGTSTSWVMVGYSYAQNPLVTSDLHKN